MMYSLTFSKNIPYPIRRRDLEYPTENVKFAYLIAIDKVYLDYGLDTGYTWIYTVDAFTDKALKARIYNSGGTLVFYARGKFGGDFYALPDLRFYLSTEDFRITKNVSGTATVLASEAVDLDGFYGIIGSISGSTLKAFRDDFTTPKLTATDTDIAEGEFGFTSNEGNSNFVLYPIAELLAPLTEIPKPILIIEYDVVEKTDIKYGYKYNAPDMPQDLVEVSKDQVSPEEWKALQSNPKGANGLPLINKLAVTWGAIDYKGEPTMLCAIYGGSPSYLDPKRILKHIEYARSKGLKVFKPPATPREVIELHRVIRRDRPEMLIEPEELAYQLIGSEKLEPDAVSRFYEREIINLGRIKRVPTWELRRTIIRWIERARRHRREEAEKRLRKVLKI